MRAAPRPPPPPGSPPASASARTMCHLGRQPSPELRSRLAQVRMRPHARPAMSTDGTSPRGLDGSGVGGRKKGHAPPAGVAPRRDVCRRCRNGVRALLHAIAPRKRHSWRAGPGHADRAGARSAAPGGAVPTVADAAANWTRHISARGGRGGDERACRAECAHSMAASVSVLPHAWTEEEELRRRRGPRRQRGRRTRACPERWRLRASPLATGIAQGATA